MKDIDHHSPILFLHGGPGFKDYLEPYFSGIKGEENFNFYNQTQGREASIQDLLNQLDEIVNGLGEAPLVLGHSWGGVLAVEYARRHDKKLQGLCLVGTGLSHEQWTYYVEELKKKGLEGAPPEDIFLSDEEKGIGGPFLKQIWEGFSPQTFESLSNNYLHNFDLLTDLSSINLPILNVMGAQDLRFPTKIGLSFKKHNRNIKDLLLPKSGHFPFLVPDVARLIIEEFRRTCEVL